MPIHDWSRVEPGIFHDFHQVWTTEIRNSLNSGGLPPGYFAMVEQYTGHEYPDVVALEWRPKGGGTRPVGTGVAVADLPPQARFVTSAEIDPYVRRANRVVIKHPVGDVVAVIEIVSPGNKHSRQALRDLVEKSVELLRRGIHLLVVDVFPPSPRDPQGIHKAIWDEIVEEPFELPPDKPLTIAAYSAGPPPTAYVEPVAVGDELPSALPLFLSPGTYVPAPLESTYQATWAKCPEPIRELVE
ncbi:MAG TPA: DUF4058 family protein [Planctomycetaceae bacterium]|nr:DUF4058 family protein [Planctomycetaceae bacterium]